MTQPTSPPGEAGLTREMLLDGTLRANLAKMMPDVRLTTDAERAASIAGILAARPDHGDGVWVFAYGSLIWNPAIHIAEQRIAIAVGWHRSFCLSVKMGRGTPENPGLMLGLRPGGNCPGVALRVAEHDIALELDLLWRREMVADGYIPRWVPLIDETGAPAGAGIAFTINPAQPTFCGDIAEDEVVQRLATARGRLGTGAEYLFRTHDGLAALGVNDPSLDRLATLVRVRMAALAAG
ncbi:MAG: gamma-glutamylcyclotransferase [Alphaproteobacteria bacterium]|nr:gamma-glutamylcyclotransferase [Alphaproteobacteria bacterium]